MRGVRMVAWPLVNGFSYEIAFFRVQWGLLAALGVPEGYPEQYARNAQYA